jgi:Yip1 domain
MLSQMLQGSLAVVTRPRIETFAEHQRDNLAWGVIYVAIGGAINAALLGLGMLAQLQFTGEQLRLAQEQLAGTPMAAIYALIMNPLAYALLTFVSTPLLYLISVALLYAIVRAFGGGATYGQLAYTNALYTVPIGAGSVLLSTASVGLLACLVAPVSLAVAGYSIFLQYLAIRATSGLPKDRTIGAIAVLIGLGLVFGCVVGVAMVGAIISAMPSLQ